MNINHIIASKRFFSSVKLLQQVKLNPNKCQLTYNCYHMGIGPRGAPTTAEKVISFVESGVLISVSKEGSYTMTKFTLIAARVVIRQHLIEDPTELEDIKRI